MPGKRLRAWSVRSPPPRSPHGRTCSRSFNAPTNSSRRLGFEEARRAFNEDARWKQDSIYLFVTELTPDSDVAVRFVFPPDLSQEGMPRGSFDDAFGGDYSREFYRVVDGFGEGWLYYGFRNLATGRVAPKVSYVKSINWDGNAAFIGAGIYIRDLPGTCEPSEVHAMGLEAAPSSEKLAEFVPLCGHGDGITGLLRRPRPVERSPLEERIDLSVRLGHLRPRVVQR